MKICRTCRKNKDLIDFQKFSKNRDGLKVDCSVCCDLKQMIRQQKHKPKEKAVSKKRALLIARPSKVCSDCQIDKKKSEFTVVSAHRDGLSYICKECQKLHRALFPKSVVDLEKIRVRGKLWRSKQPKKPKKIKKNKDPVKVNAATIRYRTKNPEKTKAATKRWQLNNPAKLSAVSMKRHAAKLKATPLWLTDQHFKLILDFYIQCSILTELTGIIFQVDHIVPLQGKEVIGLHVPWNLQILPRHENIRKSNNFDPVEYNNVYLAPLMEIVNGKQ